MNNPRRLLSPNSLFLCVIFLGILDSNAAAAAQDAPQPETFMETELIVTLEPGTPASSLRPILEAHGAVIAQALDDRVIRVSAAPGMTESLKAALEKSRGISRVDYNHTLRANFIPSDAFYSWQWHLPDVQAPTAWDITRGDPRVVIAVLDSGVDAAHPNLRGKVIGGYNFINNTPDAVTDSYGHGTMVAGIAAAPTGAGGVVGVCPECSIMSVVVADGKGCSNDFALSRGIRYAADNGAKIINISYGGAVNNPILRDAVNYAWSKGAVIIASAGNEASSARSFPAAYANVIAVSALDKDNRPAGFTDYGSWIDISAPGVGIVTTGLHGKYASGSGTSFSAAIIAGLAGLIYSENPDLTNTQVVHIITNFTDRMDSEGFDRYYGFGKANLEKALAEAKELSSAKPGATLKGTSYTRLNKKVF